MTPRIAVDGGRLLSRLEELGELTATPGRGVTREAWSDLDVEARDRVAGWMREAGLDPSVDAAANLIGRRPGPTGRWLASGSHLDTVVHGGALDGAYGVVAAVEVAASLHGAGRSIDHGLLVVAFANEEGARGTSGMTGSHACVGLLDDRGVAEVDHEGVTVGQRMAAAGGDPDRIGSARWPVHEVDAFVELHIEQGPVLDAAGVRVGAVSGITGRQGLDVHIVGAANHAGTTPMDLRHDVLAAAAEVILAIEALPRPGGIRVATCGHLAVVPSVRNVVPGEVVVGAELRAASIGAIEAGMREVEAMLHRIAEARGVAIEHDWGQRVQPRDAAPAVAASTRAAAAANGLDVLDLPSGAGHDAQVVAAAVPVGMIFVPSRGGISHSPDEHTEADDLVVGAQVLLDTLLDLDRRTGADGAEEGT